MDLGSPLASLTGPIDAAVLRALARTSAPLSGRQIHRVAGTGSPAGVNAALARLANTGLVLASVRTYATLYRLNRDHLLWPAVDGALAALTHLRSRIRSYAERHGPQGIVIVLYGSVDRGDATAESDVDLLIVFPDATTESDAADFTFELSDQVRLWTGNPAQAVRLTASQLRESSNRGDPLVDTWLTDSEVIVGDPGLLEAR